MLMPLLFPYALSVPADCPAVIKLAASLNMPYTQMIKLNSNCCTATDLVTCEGSRVTHLTWASLGLYGTINTSLVFPTLLTLDLSSNLFSGPLPLLVESTTLLGLDLSGNKFNGTIPTISSSFLFFSLYFNSLSGVIPAIPSSVEYLFLDSNFLTGTIPLLPSALTQVWLSFNLLTGSIPGLPSALEVLYFDSNFLTGTIPPIPPTVAEFGVSYNLLSGVVPALSSYQMSYVYLQGNRLSGKLSVNEPIDLLINNNYISDVVVQSVISLNATACDLSNNPLLGNSRIQNLVTKGCKVLGLYAESLLPFTLTTSISKRSSHSSLLTTAAMSKTSTNDAKTFSTSTTYKTISSAYARTISSSPNGPYLVSTLVHTHAAVAPLGSVTIKIPWTSSLQTQQMKIESTQFFSIDSEVDSIFAGESATMDIDVQGTTILVVTSEQVLPTSLISIYDQDNTPNTAESIVDPTIVYALIGGIVGICVLLVIASKVVKNPKMNSKFGRNNSFGTLNTIQAKE